MRKWLLHIFLVSVLGMLTASCSQEADDPTQTNTGSGTIRIQFSLAMDESRVSRAATWNDITGDATDNTDNDVRAIGNNYENMIDLDHLQVFLFDSNGRYLGEVGNLNLNPASSSSTTYTFTGEVLVNGVDVTTEAGVKKLKNCTIMVTANYEGYVNGNLAVTQNYLFDYIADNYRPIVTGNTTSYNSYIPMWGMLKTDLPLYADRTAASAADVGKIYMLRSLAKIEVVLGDAVDEDYVIMGATLNKYNQQGYLLPTKYPSSTNGVADSYFNANSTSVFNTETCINAYSSIAPTGNLAFNVADDNKSCVIYVPEYSANSTDLKINLQVATKDAPATSISGELDSEGTFTLDSRSLVRNHWYKCTVNSIDYNTGFDLTLAVAPWIPNEDMLDYTENTVGYNVTGNDYGWKNHYGFDKDDSKILYLNTGNNVDPATYKFLLMTPLNAEWKAVLNGSSNLEFVEGDGYSGELVESNGSNITVQGFNGSTYDGTVITLGVKAKDSNAVGQYSAILHFYVNLGNKWYEIDLVDGNESNGLNYWTIKHNKSSV